jgi:3'-phosphoadenosine 5'-phosphosulfate sulfotransferase (PAPS reductase)/FAD synthetase
VNTLEIFRTTTPSKLVSQIRSYSPENVLVSISGGKDSTALILWALSNFQRSKITLVHSIIDIDWKETLPIVREQAAHFNLPLVEVQAVDIDGNKKGFLDHLQAPRKNRKKARIIKMINERLTAKKVRNLKRRKIRPMASELANERARLAEKLKLTLYGENQFPSMSARWCTSILKSGPINKYAGNMEGRTLVLIGERREESGQREKLKAWRPLKKTKTKEVINCSPILDVLENDIWTINKESKAPIHPCYKFVDRASCGICIFSSDKDILNAAKFAPQLVADYIRAEKTISHTFRYKAPTKKRGAIKETIFQILEKQNFKVNSLLERY